MSTSYSEIYERFLNKITDYSLASLAESEVEDILKVHLKSAIVKFKLCEQDLTDRDDTIDAFNIILTSEEIEILSTLIIVEWSNAIIFNLELLKQNFSTREFSLFSSSNLLDKLITLRKMMKSEANELITLYYHSV